MVWTLRDMYRGIMEAHTIALRNVHFPTDSRVMLRSKIGELNFILLIDGYVNLYDTSHASIRDGHTISTTLRDSVGHYNSIAKHPNGDPYISVRAQGQLLNYYIYFARYKRCSSYFLRVRMHIGRVQRDGLINLKQRRCPLNNSRKDQMVSESDAGTGDIRKMVCPIPLVMTLVFYQSNPLADSAELKSEIATGVWKNAFIGAGVGVIDMDDYILTPYVGLIVLPDYIKSDTLLNDKIMKAQTRTLFFLHSLVMLVRKGWRIIPVTLLASAGEGNASKVTNISVMKSYSISDAHRGMFKLECYHNSEVDPLSENDIDFKNVDLFASYALSSTF